MVSVSVDELSGHIYKFYLDAGAGAGAHGRIVIVIACVGDEGVTLILLLVKECREVGGLIAYVKLLRLILLLSVNIIIIRESIGTKGLANV